MFPIRSTRLPHQAGALRIVLRPHASSPSPSRPLRTAAAIRSLSFAPLIRPSNGELNFKSTSITAQSRGQVRWSTSSDRRPEPASKVPVGQILRQALRFSSLFQGRNLKQLFRDSPEETVLALLLLAGTIGCIGYAVWLYFNYFYAEQFTKYPPDVAKSLRRALYYSSEKLDPQLAIKYFKLAIEQCHANGLDPFSDDVTGIKIQIAAWLEKLDNKKGAIHVLGLLLAEHKKWLSLVDTAPEKLPKAPLPGTVVAEGDLERTITKDEFDRWVWSSRNRVLGKSCQISIKLGELYSDDQVLDSDKSHEHLMWGVETSLKEFRRRASEGVKEGEGPWLTPQQIGAALESLGGSYERREQFDLALPLFFQALRLCQDQCHMAVIKILVEHEEDSYVLVNNLAVSFAQHPPRAPYDTLAGIVPGEEHQASSSTTSEQIWTRKDLLESAQIWAKNALSHAREPTGAKRTPECDQACAVALVNLGDIASINGDIDLARRRYERAIQVSQENNFADGVEQAQAGLSRLSR